MDNILDTEEMIRICWTEFSEEALTLFAHDSAFRLNAKEHFRKCLWPLLNRIKELEEKK